MPERLAATSVVLCLGMRGFTVVVVSPAAGTFVVSLAGIVPPASGAAVVSSTAGHMLFDLLVSATEEYRAEIKNSHHVVSNHDKYT